MSRRFRAPIFDTIRKTSPFEGLWAHASKVRECLDSLHDTLHAFTNGHQDKVAELADHVSKKELEADQLKSNIRNHLPGNVRMPVDKALFLDTLAQQDAILDGAEDAAIWMSMRQHDLPDEISDGLVELLHKVIETVEAYETAVANTHDLVGTGFVKRERDEEKVLIHAIHELEHETDVLSNKLSRTLLQPESEKRLGSVGVVHLLKLVLQISKIADSAENAGDRLRAMLSR